MQVAPNQSGSLVYKIDPLAPAHDVLKESDVVLEIDKVPIADDGTVEFRNEERVEFSHIVRAKHIGTFSFPHHTADMPCCRMRQLKMAFCTNNTTCTKLHLIISMSSLLLIPPIDQLHL